MDTMVEAISQSVMKKLQAQGAQPAPPSPDGSGGINFSHYGVAMPGVDDLLDKAVNESDFDALISDVEAIETQVLKDLPDMGIITLSYVIARNPRVDLGYEVKSGYAYWPLHKAKYV